MAVSCGTNDQIKDYTLPIMFFMVYTIETNQQASIDFR